MVKTVCCAAGKLFCGDCVLEAGVMEGGVGASRMVNGRLLLWTGQMESLSGLVLMVLNRTGRRMAPTMLALLLSGGRS